MKYINYYSSPLGKLLMAADDIGLTGLWFENQLHYAYNLDPEHQEKELPVFKQTKNFIVRSRKANIVFTGVSTNGGLPFFLLLVMIL